MDAKLRVDIRKWVEGQVINNHRWSERLYSLQIEAPIEDVQAGQFGRLGLVIDEELVGRPYSFVNAPDERPLEFYFITVPGGPVSNRLIKLDPGAPIWVARKPAGFFTLSEVQDAESLWLFATGTALGPFLSILKTDEPWERFPKIILIHAVRTAEELTYRDSHQAVPGPAPKPVHDGAFCQSREPSARDPGTDHRGTEGRAPGTEGWGAAHSGPVPGDDLW